MDDLALKSAPRFSRRGALARRWLLKGLLFTGMTVLVLNPNLKRALLQVRHVLDPEQLVQTEFPGLARMNAQVDCAVAANHGRYSEARLIAKFVLREIQYVSDYENWGNIEYWPSAQEVWRARREDCDGRAILTASILRSRGFKSARLVVGLDHMWVQVDENEKEPFKPSRLIALLNPNPNVNLDLREEPGPGEFWVLAKALLHPTALRETGTHLFAEMPVLRKAILIMTLLLLCFHPCKHKTGLLAVMAVGLLGVMLLADWQPGNGRLLGPLAGAALLLGAATAALLMNKLLRTRSGVGQSIEAPVTSPVLGRNHIFIFILLAAVLAGTFYPARAEDWPCWRGPRGDGTSLEKDVPVHWSSELNIAWKTPVPGKGHASPIVVGNRVFTISALADTQERLLLCFDRDTGKLLWSSPVVRAPLEKMHPLNSHASSTPASDGERVYVTFLDGRQMAVAAYDFAGRQRWLVRPGPFTSMHGFCSSPLLFEDKVIVNGDHDGDSYIVALSRKDGHTLWKTPRENHTRSYCAPIIRKLDGRVQMVLSGDKCIASYNPADGSRHWIIDGPTEQFVASPVYSAPEDLLFVTGGFPDHHILAIKTDGHGNVTRTHIAWRTNKGAAYVPSPIIAGDYFLIVSDSGVAHCFLAKSGALLWQERVGSHHASLVSANGMVYFLADNGETVVVKPGPTFEASARNSIGERCFASPAISQGRIFVRGDNSLFCIGAR